MRYSIPVAYALWLFSGCGWLGLHRFYLGKTGTGILWILTGGLGGFGLVYDFFTLPRQVEKRNLEVEVRAAIELESRGYPMRRGGPASSAPAKESVEHSILRAAKKNGGLVTPGEVALEADITMEEARNALEKLAAAGHAEMRVRSSGVVVYVFNEFVRDDSGSFEV